MTKYVLILCNLLQTRTPPSLLPSIPIPLREERGLSSLFSSIFNSSALSLPLSLSLRNYLIYALPVFLKAGGGCCDVGGLDPERRDSRPKKMKRKTTMKMKTTTKIPSFQPPSEVPIEPEASPKKIGLIRIWGIVVGVMLISADFALASILLAKTSSTLPQPSHSSSYTAKLLHLCISKPYGLSSSKPTMVAWWEGGLDPEHRDSRPKTTTTKTTTKTIPSLQQPSEVPIEPAASPQHEPQ
jgi:hypothetical protein